MAEPFSTIEDYTDRWPLKPSLATRCATLLGDASLKIRQEIRRAGRDIDAEIEAETLDPDVPKLVVVDMVHRALASETGTEDTVPMKAVQQTWGQFQQTLTPINPSGDLYLTKGNRRDLGLGGQRAFSVDLLGS